MENDVRTLEVKYRSQIKRIINKNIHHLGVLNQSTYEEDTKQAFDFIYEFKNSKIPVRIRDNTFLRYRDLTIRSKAMYNGRTEYDKLLDGFGDVYLYAWENINKTSFTAYMLVDLHIFRSSGLINKIGKPIANNDGTQFYNFSIQDLIMYDSLKVYEYL